ncbi:MAG: arylsulfatase [Chloroflexi bacterium]|nr:arylsulfatase [Chloroflexota bacterium]|tara:strand:- start:2311 stop:3597 length:1287 start_codon:yes stop_codon:yes gene_type:complete
MSKKPNIILILSDDLGYETLGCYGGTSYKTPVLDNLASTGAMFNNAHVQPLCTPTRVQLMSGKYNFRNYIGFGLMDPNERTFGHIYSDNGYKTCIAGKWQLYSYNPPDEKPEDRNKGQKIEDAGFDEYCVWHAHQTEEKGSRYKDPIIYQNGKYLNDTKDKYGDDIFADYIIDFIDKNQDEQFFVYFPMTLTHDPKEPTPDSEEYKFFEPPSNKTLGGKTFDELENWDDDPKFYKDMVEYHDKVIGKIVSKLDQLNLRDDTIIIYAGDNGTTRGIISMMGDKKIIGGKGLTSDTGTHVPLICNWLGTVKNETIINDLIDASDFLPTMLDISDIKNSDLMDGKSFYPQILGNKGNPRDWIYFYFDPNSPRLDRPVMEFVREKKWKLYSDNRMFDVLNDPDETNEISFDQDGETQEAYNNLKDILENIKN